MKFRDDKGFALATTLGAVFLVSAIAIASYFLASRAMEQSMTSAGANRAFQTAASALEYEVSRFEGGIDLVSQKGKVLPSGESYDLDAKMVESNKLLISISAKSMGKTEKVSQEYTVLDFSETVYSGSGSIFAGPMFNSPDSKLIGAMYLKMERTERINSSVSFIDGPLYVEGGGFDAEGGVRWTTTRNFPKYIIRSEVRIPNMPTNVEVLELEEKLSPPLITDDLVDSLREKAKASGTYFNKDTVLGLPGTQFQPFHDGVFRYDGVIFVEGRATIDASIKSYTGNTTIFASNMIVNHGVLVPSDFATNPSRPPSGSYDPYYAAETGDYLPEARENYCMSLITPGPINMTWSTGNNSTSVISYCGALYSGSTIAFKESIRGAIIGLNALNPNKKTILATQQGIRDALPDEVRSLFTRVLGKGDWTRQSN